VVGLGEDELLWLRLFVLSTAGQTPVEVNEGIEEDEDGENEPGGSLLALRLAYPLHAGDLLAEHQTLGRYD